jgi:phosphate transport system permease protein
MKERGMYRGPGPHQKISEGIIRGFLMLATSISLFVTLGIVFELIQESWRFFAGADVTAREFLTSRRWLPAIGLYGISPLVTATFLTSLIGLAVAVPGGLSVGLYLSEYASPRTRSVARTSLQILSGMPTVIYGYIAISVITPMLQGVFGRNVVEPFNMASAGLAIGFLMVPYSASIMEDVLRRVPDSIRRGGYSVGAGRTEVALGAVLPAALPGVVSATMIILSRSVGETMIVAIAAGSGPNLTLNPLRGAETITGFIVRAGSGDAGGSIFALGLLLYLVTFTLNTVGRRIFNLHGAQLR